MSARPPPPKAQGKKPTRAEHADPGACETRSSLGWVRNVLGRSIGLEQRRDKLHVVLIDPRRGPPASPPLSPLLQMRAELRTRLLVHDPATQTVLNLVVVHEALALSGWSGVEALPRQLMGNAMAEAEVLQSQDSTPLMATLIERLREIGAAADLRAELERAEQEALLEEFERPEVPEASETTFDEYERMERSWVGTVPAGLDRP
jgi:hypothetical protein